MALREILICMHIKLDGTKLWRIDLGLNLRSGVATTNFLVFDFDDNRCAEICCKAGDGTMDRVGHKIGNERADWRTWDKESPTYGKIVNVPESLTVFDGHIGKELDSKEYIPTRYLLDSWGGIGANCGNDNTGGRFDGFIAVVAFLYGKTPSPVMIRGWYGRIVVAAWTFAGRILKHFWIFDRTTQDWKTYSGMGNHSVTIAYFDSDR